MPHNNLLQESPPAFARSAILLGMKNSSATAADQDLGAAGRCEFWFLGHKSIKTTMNYTHVAGLGATGVRSPLDGKVGNHFVVTLCCTSSQ